jgi:hypothetical protein
MTVRRVRPSSRPAYINIPGTCTGHPKDCDFANVAGGYGYLAKICNLWRLYSDITDAYSSGTGNPAGFADIARCKNCTGSAQVVGSVQTVWQAGVLGQNAGPGRAARASPLTLVLVLVLVLGRRYWALKQDELVPWNGPGHWNDPDMLEIGNSDQWGQGSPGR